MTTMTLTSMNALRSHLTDLTERMEDARRLACSRSESPSHRSRAHGLWLSLAAAANDAEAALPLPLREEPDGY